MILGNYFFTSFPPQRSHGNSHRICRPDLLFLHQITVFISPIDPEKATYTTLIPHRKLYKSSAPFCTIKIYLKSSRCIMVKTTERHGEAPLKDDLLLGDTGGLFSLRVD